MTFEEWLRGPSGFGNFTRGEFYAETMPQKLGDFLEDLEQAYEAGREAGYNTAVDDMENAPSRFDGRQTFDKIHSV